MKLANSSERWGALSQLMHWGVVVLIILQITLAAIADDLPLGMQKLAWLARHKSVGITILGIAVARLAWRLLSPGPALPSNLGPFERLLARITHIGLYLVLFLMPLTDWLMSSAKGFPVSWFNLVQLPDLVTKNEELFALMKDCHEALAVALIVLAVLHVAGALQHHFIRRDNVIKRMLPCFALGLAVALLASPAPAPAAEFVSDSGHSELTFSFTQAGALNSGKFNSFQVQFREPDGATVKGTLQVTIDTDSLDTGDPDRDQILRGSDLFNTKRFPVAKFVADTIEATGEGRYRASGSLTMRDVTRTLELPLTVRHATESDIAVTYLAGETTIDRLDYGVGQGEWTSTEWVANKVSIAWTVRLEAAPGTPGS